MNRFRLIMFLAIALLTSFVSCNNDIQKPIYRISSIEEVTVEGESNTVDIQMIESNWTITGVYSLNGHTMTDGNRPLKLDGLGTLDFRWFKITRDELSSLSVDIFENYEGIQRGMIIKITKGSHTEEIKIIQVKSQGYQFKEIRYTMKEESKFNNGSGSPKLIDNNYTLIESQIGIYPFKSTRETSSFQSEEEGAFNWAGEEGIEIEVPVHSSEKYFYKKSTTNHLSELDDLIFWVSTPPGKQLKVSVDIEYIKQVYNYTLILINNRTKEEKEITGEWIIEKPISYTKTLELGELPER